MKKYLALILLGIFGAIALAAILHRGGTWRKAQGWKTLTAPMYRPRKTWYVGEWAVVLCKSVPVGV